MAEDHSAEAICASFGLILMVIGAAGFLSPKFMLVTKAKPRWPGLLLFTLGLLSLLPFLRGLISFFHSAL